MSVMVADVIRRQAINGMHIILASWETRSGGGDLALSQVTKCECYLAAGGFSESDNNCFIFTGSVLLASAFKNDCRASMAST